MGESTNACATLRFDRRIRLEFRGATITSDAGLLACRELDDALCTTPLFGQSEILAANQFVYCPLQVCQKVLVDRVRPPMSDVIPVIF